MKLLLHVCCGVCLGGPLEDLARRGMTVRGYFYNPNIHPFSEFRRRLEALQSIAAKHGLDVLYDERYGLEDFLREVLPNDPDRCLRCYRMRLRRTARMAKESRYDAFSTTLLVSRHQKHELIRQAGLEAEKEFGVSFFYEDWRPVNFRSLEAARDAGIYRQRYCACIFSEYENAKRKT